MSRSPIRDLYKIKENQNEIHKAISNSNNIRHKPCHVTSHSHLPLLHPRHRLLFSILVKIILRSLFLFWSQSWHSWCLMPDVCCLNCISTTETVFLLTILINDAKLKHRYWIAFSLKTSCFLFHKTSMEFLIGVCLRLKTEYFMSNILCSDTDTERNDCLHTDILYLGRKIWKSSRTKKRHLTVCMDCRLFSQRFNLIWITTTPPVIHTVAFIKSINLMTLGWEASTNPQKHLDADCHALYIFIHT